MGTETQSLRLDEIPGRGRSLVSERTIRGGEIVLRDSPLFLYSAVPIVSSSPQRYCNNCFRLIPVGDDGATTVLTCGLCSQSFCSGSCSSSPSHSQWSCHAMSKLQQFPPNFGQELQVQYQYLVAAYNLSLTFPEKFQILLSLHGDGTPNDGVRLLHSHVPHVESAVSQSPALTALLLAKDKFNAFGLMEPFDERNEGRRTVRAYGIYPKAALFNHDCLPNACRFDYVDGGEGTTNTDIVVRMIHDVPEGREVCLSYFPVNLRFSERQRLLFEDYGFKCDCDRCRVESAWSDNDEDGPMAQAESEEDEEMDEADDVPASNNNGSGDDDNDFPHAYFFARFMCSREHCWGTLAPLGLGAAHPSLLECNVCGYVSKDEAA